MTASFLIDALRLPPDCHVEQRIPKKLLLEQSLPTAADKRAIQEGLDELWWMAAIKPTNVGIPEFRDEQREYLEIAVLLATFRDPSKTLRLTELIHRAIPYPLVLVATQTGKSTLSLAHKRWSQGETGKVVVECILMTEAISSVDFTPQEASFLAAIDMARQPAKNLWTLYQGWWEQVEALSAARITGTFSVPSSAMAAEQRRHALAEYDRLQKEIATLRAQAMRESQINRRVELNLQIDLLRAQIAAHQKSL